MEDSLEDKRLRVNTTMKNYLRCNFSGDENREGIEVCIIHN